MENIRDRLLVVDDEMDIRDGCERILTRMNCEVIKAACGDEALNLMAKTPPSIVLLDLKMPGIDGMEVLRRIQRIDDSIPVIVLTGFATLETAVEAMKKGSYDFVSKPFEPDQLRIVVKRALENRRLVLEKQRLEIERKKNLADLDAEKSRIRTIIESLPNGIVITNARGNVVLMNPAFRSYMALDRFRKAGDCIDAYTTDKDFCELVHGISRGEHSGSILSCELATSDSEYLLVRGQSVKDENAECIGAVVILTDITDMKEVNHLKSEFVNMVSHELRSPLATIHEQLALVVNDMGVRDEETQHILVRTMERTRNLIALIGDLLDLSRIEAGNNIYQFRELRLETILEDIVEFLTVRAVGKGQELTLEVPEVPGPVVMTDHRSLESIFGNLISNAINYTPNGGEIKVRTCYSIDEVHISVEDNGIGIGEEYQNKIFDNFYRVKNEETRYIIGTGLGLPIVKKLVEDLGGAISLESRPEKGTCFTVSLPLGN